MPREEVRLMEFPIKDFPLILLVLETIARYDDEKRTSEATILHSLLLCARRLAQETPAKQNSLMISKKEAFSVVETLLLFAGLYCEGCKLEHTFFKAQLDKKHMKIKCEKCRATFKYYLGEHDELTPLRPRFFSNLMKDISETVDKDDCYVWVKRVLRNMDKKKQTIEKLIKDNVITEKRFFFNKQEKINCK